MTQGTHFLSRPSKHLKLCLYDPPFPIATVFQLFYYHSSIIRTSRSRATSSWPSRYWICNLQQTNGATLEPYAHIIPSVRRIIFQSPSIAGRKPVEKACRPDGAVVGLLSSYLGNPEMLWWWHQGSVAHEIAPYALSLYQLDLLEAFVTGAVD